MCDSTYLPSIESQSKDSFHDYLYDFTIPLYICFKSLDISSRYFLSIIIQFQESMQYIIVYVVTN